MKWEREGSPPATVHAARKWTREGVGGGCLIWLGVWVLFGGSAAVFQAFRPPEPDYVGPAVLIGLGLGAVLGLWYAAAHRR